MSEELEKVEFRNSSTATHTSPSYGYMSKQRTLTTIKESLIRYLSRDIHEALQILFPSDVLAPLSVIIHALNAHKTHNTIALLTLCVYL